MKTINTYINERLHINTKSFYTCQPKTKDELQEIIIQRIKDEGYECDLNDIDVSNITDMSYLFDWYENEIFDKFNGDISQWNVSNVKNMAYMFNLCDKFNGDLSHWNVSNVNNMKCMFSWCKSFKQNLDNWNVSNVEEMTWAFDNCPTKPRWYNIKEWE